MTTKHDSIDRPSQACIDCWEALVASGRTGRAPASSVLAHVKACPSCRSAAARAEALGASLSALATRIESAAASQAWDPADHPPPDVMIRLARWEAWHRASRRAAVASVGIAACVAIVLGVWVSMDSRVPSSDAGPQGVNTGSMVADRPSESTVNQIPLDSAVASAIPVGGWIDLPPSGTSADSSLWWVVLSYGGQQ